jgi:hypothetical protein
LGNDRGDDVVLAYREESVHLAGTRRRFLCARADDRKFEGEKKDRRADPLKERSAAR